MASAWDSFERIVCIYCPNHADRKDGLMGEFGRIGLLPEHLARFSLHENHATVADGYIRNAMKEKGFDVHRTLGEFKLSLVNHEILKCAALDKCESILILEDDIRFLKDVPSVHDIVSSWRDAGCDVVLFDRFLRRARETKPFTTSSGKKFVRFSAGVRGASCYALTRRGIEAAVSAFESGINGDRRELICGDVVYDSMHVEKCFTETCACIQKEFDDNMNLNLYGVHQYDFYRRDGVDVSRYNI